MEISVRQINIKPKYIRTLLTHSIVLVSHLNALDANKLAQRTKLKTSECEEILAAIKPKRPHYVMKASEFMVRPFDKISTLIKGLDDALGGGIRCGQITEVSGEAGAGKSNLAAEIATLVMMPKSKNGLDGHVLFIHTEGEGKLKLTIKRFNTLANSLSFSDDESSDQLRKKLHVVNCSSDFELLEIANRLSDTLDKIPTVKLIIIDSITCAFIQEDQRELNFEFYTKRSLKLTKLIKTLSQLAWNRRLAILVTNHVSFNTKLGELKPAMGKLWSHMCQTKIYLERQQTSYELARYAYVTKGAINTPEIAQFRISDRMQS